jgi:4-methylaminobutanoate oxidase (formaldehyde-forming)
VRSSFGVEFEYLSPAEAGDRAPILRTDDLAARVDPRRRQGESDRPHAVAGRRRAHARRAHLEGVQVTGVDAQRPRRRRHVARGERDGDDRCETSSTARASGRASSARVRRNVPLVSAEHFYIVTSRSTASRRAAGDPRPDGFIYYKEESAAS